MHRPSRLPLLILAVTALFLVAPGCSSDSSDNESTDAGDTTDNTELPGGTVTTTDSDTSECTQILDEVQQRLEGFHATVDTADLQSIEAHVNAGTDALIEAQCADGSFGDLSQTRCDFLQGLEGTDAQSTAVLTGFQDACTEE